MDLFHENLRKWQSTLSGQEGASLEPPSLLERSEGLDFLYQQKDPSAEALEWFAALDLNHVQTIYIYGIGLGYYYEAALGWLSQDKDRYLVFLEDDPLVMRSFLQTKLCTEILANPQVYSCLLGSKNQVLQLTQLVSPFTFSKYLVTGLKSYVQNKNQAYFQLKAMIAFMLSMTAMLFGESAGHGIAFFRNFFLNYLDLPRSYLANGLLGKFEGIPAIICGAGPSLNKNVDVLATLSDRALIFAGGTALNALNGKGVMPHFGVGIDPNSDQFTRLVMNHAFELPFLYRARMLHEALEMVHGDRLYVTGSGGYDVAKWIEKELGVDNDELEEGFNVLNFSLMIAHAMGCNPIICVGIDLAYSAEGDSYAAGVINHPIHSRQGNFRTKGIDDELISKNDINGKPLFTLWKWIAESLWYSHFSAKHPETTLINATEGGIGFPKVPNMSLAKVKEEYLTKQYDLMTRLHGEIQNSQLPETFNEQAIITKIRTLMDSLSNCGKHYQKLIELLTKEESPQANEKSCTEEISEKEKELLSETAYEVILKKFNADYLNYQELDLRRYHYQKDQLSEEDSNRQKATLDLSRYRFLKDTAFLNSSLVYSMLDQREQREQSIKLKRSSIDSEMQQLQKQYPLPKPKKEEEYRFDQTALILKDPELGIDYAEGFPENTLRREALFYPSGQLKVETFYREGLIHGPSLFYAENGRVLAHSWFLNGRQEGKMWTYYATGPLHSLQLFYKGLKVGLHHYFYPSGLLKSLLPYKEGNLHGQVLLFSPSGLLIRKLAFKEGKRSGQEQIWNERGTLIVESQFEEDRPVGLTRLWHPNGQQAKEFVYDQDSHLIEVKEWEDSGTLLVREESKKFDYFDLVNQEKEHLTSSLTDLVIKMSEIVPLVLEKSGSDCPKGEASTFPDIHGLGAEIAKLKEEMDHLQSLDEKLKEHLVKDAQDPKEAIWKTPSSRQEMEKQFEGVSDKMNSDLQDIQKNIKTFMDRLLNKDRGP